MEQTVVDFISKSSELILGNRLSYCENHSTGSASQGTSSKNKFQLSLSEKYFFSTKIPAKWGNQTERILVLEFFLTPKKNPKRYLVEQWIFELDQVPESKLKFTIDSHNALYKRLAMLLRTISVLSVMVPLSSYFLSKKDHKLAENFTLEYEIHFKSGQLAEWHSSFHEEKNLTSYKNPEIILPGRLFRFQMTYAKDLSLLHKLVEEPFIDLSLVKGPSSERVSFGEVLGVKEEQLKRQSSEGNILNPFPISSRTRKSTMDTTINRILSQGDSLKEGQSFSALLTEQDSSPVESIFSNIPIETQREHRRRTSSIGSGCNLKTSYTRQRFQTIDSESIDGFELCVCGDDDTELEEIEADGCTKLLRRQSSLKGDSPKRLYSRDNDDKAEREGFHRLTLTKPIMKIIEQTDDDKVADIIMTIDDLRDMITFNQEKPKSRSKKAISKCNSKFSEITKAESPAKSPNQSLRFEKLCVDRPEAEKRDILDEFNELKTLYNKLKC